MQHDLKKILYVEDDESIARIVQLSLNELGNFNVHHAPSGKEALDVYGSFKPDLLLLDVMMPQMDGIETLKRIRDMESEQAAPAIFMTAKAQKHEQEEYLRVGAIGVIKKPFDPVNLPEDIVSIWQTCV